MKRKNIQTYACPYLKEIAEKLDAYMKAFIEAHNDLIKAQKEIRRLKKEDQNALSKVNT